VQSIRDFSAFNEMDADPNTRNVFPESPRSEANIEVEKGEKIIARDGMSIFDVGGKKHYDGGTPVKAEPGSYVVSDYIKAPKLLQAKMGFQVKSNKGKDNTWARVLESKVPTKDFNKLAEFLKQAATNVDSDKYELATAKNKMAVYQDYISKAATPEKLEGATANVIALEAFVLAPTDAKVVVPVCTRKDDWAGYVAMP
jgi:hypothetical protein